MNKQTLMQLLYVHWDDISAVDPQALGVITLVLHRDARDNLETHMAANVSPDVVRFALASLVADWATGGSANIETVRPPKLRKAT